MRQKKEIDWETVDALRKRGVSLRKVAAALNIPFGTLTRRLYERLKDVKSETNPSPAPAEVAKEGKRQGLDSYPPREMIKHLYKLGYRIENNGLYVITKQQVKLGDIINE